MKRMAFIVLSALLVVLSVVVGFQTQMINESRRHEDMIGEIREKNALLFYQQAVLSEEATDKLAASQDSQ